MLTEQEKTIYKLYIRNSKGLRCEHEGVIDRLAIWRQLNSETAKMVALVSINGWAKQIVIPIYETPYTTYEKDKLLFIEQSMHQIMSKRLFLSYAGFRNVAWRICDKVTKEALDELIDEVIREEAKK